jgi:hypothetical protein
LDDNETAEKLVLAAEALYGAHATQLVHSYGTDDHLQATKNIALAAKVIQKLGGQVVPVDQGTLTAHYVVLDAKGKPVPNNVRLA